MSSVTGKLQRRPSLPPIWGPILAEEMEGSMSVRAAVCSSSSCCESGREIYPFLNVQQLFFYVKSCYGFAKKENNGNVLQIKKTTTK